MRTIDCKGCNKKHPRTPSIRHMAHPQTGKQGWFCEKWFTPTPHEHVPERIKEQRRVHAKDMLQPHREGVPSREFIEAYPESAKGMFTKKEIRKAKYVWK